jgi:Amt family ammonium transporter
VVVVGVFAFVVSFIVIYIINKILPIAADEEEQLEGLDSVECGIESYPEFTRTI